MHEDTANEIRASVPSIGEAINKAAKHLPPGYIIRIEIENGGYGVELQQPNGLVMTFDSDGIIGEVNDAICCANGYCV